jgi:hypothetical protein
VEAAEGLISAVPPTLGQAGSAALAAVPLAPAATGTARAAGRRIRTPYIAGDPTAARKDTAEAPETGWGSAFDRTATEQDDTHVDPPSWITRPEASSARDA